MTSSTLALQPYTVREALSADLRSALERVSAIGLRQVELFDVAHRADDHVQLPDALRVIEFDDYAGDVQARIEFLVGKGETL